MLSLSVSFLNLRCTIETASFENIFAENIAPSPYTCYSMFNVSAVDFAKLWKKLTVARCSSNDITSFNEGKHLQFTDTHCLEINLVCIKYIPRHIPFPLQSRMKITVQSQILFYPNIILHIFFWCIIALRILKQCSLY